MNGGHSLKQEGNAVFGIFMKLNSIKIKRNAILCNSGLAFLGMLLFPEMGISQDACGKLEENRQWQNGMNELMNAINNRDLVLAKTQAAQLSEICSMSPHLNYLQGQIAEGLEERVKAAAYYQKASDYSYVYKVSPEFVKKIWTARYENEHPESRPSQIRALNEKIDALSIENEELRKTKPAPVIDLSEVKREHNRGLIWGGTGMAITGLLAAGAGVALVMISEPCEDIKLSDHSKLGKYTYQANAVYSTGWALAGGGAALLVTGIVLAGVYGYRYTHADEDKTVSFGVAPGSATFKIEF